MRNLLYYPYFEIKNENWLKFALLYLRDLNIIIPESADRHLSVQFNEIYDRTDLIKRYRPDYSIAYNASLDAIETIEPILMNPGYYSYAFNLRDRNISIIDKWRNSQNHNSELYSEKYTDVFIHFCERNRFCQRSPNGILVPEELAAIYMSLLAQVIGDRDNLAPITDINKFDFLSNRLRMASSHEDKIYLAKNVIEVKLPANLNRINIQDIISLRKDQGFNQSLDAFQNSINEFQTSIENGNTTQEYMTRFEIPFREITEDLKKITRDFVSFYFGSWIILNNAEVSIPAFLKDIVVGGLTTYTTNKIRVKRTWRNIDRVVQVRKYFTYLKRLPFSRYHR